MLLFKVYLDEVVDKVQQPLLHVVDAAVDAIIGLFHVDAHGQEYLAQLTLEVHVEYVDLPHYEFPSVAQFALGRCLHVSIYIRGEKLMHHQGSKDFYLRRLVQLSILNPLDQSLGLALVLFFPYFSLAFALSSSARSSLPLWYFSLAFSFNSSRWASLYTCLAAFIFSAFLW